MTIFKNAEPDLSTNSLVVIGNQKDTFSELMNNLRDVDTLVAEIDQELIRSFQVPDIENCYKLWEEKEILSPAVLICNILTIYWIYRMKNETDVFIHGVANAILDYLDEMDGNYIIQAGGFWLLNFNELSVFMSHTLEDFLASSYDLDDEVYSEELLYLTSWKGQLRALCSTIYNIWISKMFSIIRKLLDATVFYLEAMPGVEGNFNDFIPMLFESNIMYSTDNLLVLFEEVYWRMKSMKIEDEVRNVTMQRLLNHFDVVCFNSLILSPGIFINDNKGDWAFAYNLNKYKERVSRFGIPDYEPFYFLTEIQKLRETSRQDLLKVKNIPKLAPNLTDIQIQTILCQYIHDKTLDNPFLKAFLKKSTKRGPHENPVIEDLVIDFEVETYDDPFLNWKKKKLDVFNVYIPILLNIPVIEKIITLFKSPHTVKETDIGRIELFETLKILNSAQEEFNLEDFLFYE